MFFQPAIKLLYWDQTNPLNQGHAIDKVYIYIYMLAIADDLCNGVT